MKIYAVDGYNGRNFSLLKKEKIPQFIRIF